MKKAIMTAATVSLFTAPSALSADYKVHILKEGETLSELLHAEDFSPLYGKEHWVEKTLRANRLKPGQANKIRSGMPVILPAKEQNTSDTVSLAQAAPVSHGLFGGKISRHQKVEAVFQYHLSSLNAGKERVVSKENYGLFLRYQDNNDRKWQGMGINPEIEAGVITHGTNRSDQEILSYDPTVFLRGQAALKSRFLDAAFGPSLSYEMASRAVKQDDGLAIRRDHLLWAGVFASKSFALDKDVMLELKGSLAKSALNRTADDAKPLSAWRNGLALEVNLTRDYFFEVFANYETYDNENIESASATGARLSYLLQ